MAASGEPQHKRKNPAALTPLEELIHGYRKQGLTYGQIAKELGGKWSAATVGNKLKVIREKLACQ